MAVLFTGCVGPNGPLVGAVGAIYTDVSGPVSATSNTGASKSGSAESKAVICVAWG